MIKKCAMPLAAALLLFASAGGVRAADAIAQLDVTRTLAGTLQPQVSTGGSGVMAQPQTGMLGLNRANGSAYILPVRSGEHAAGASNEAQATASGESEHGALILAGLMMVGVVVSKRLMR